MLKAFAPDHSNAGEPFTFDQPNEFSFPYRLIPHRSLKGDVNEGGQNSPCHVENISLI